MKKTIALLLALVLCLALCACGGNGAESGAPENSQVLETENISIEGICVDDSYVDDEGSPLKMVYLFYNFTAVDSNLKIDSKYTEMTIGETNTYESDNFADSAAACDYTKNYYYSSYIEDVYLGTSLKVIATFKVPEGDLAPGKVITFADSQIPGIEAIKISTDSIQRFATPEELAQAMDPEGYASEMLAREDADAETANAVMNKINGYYWSFYVNNTAYEIEFWAPNNFEVRTAFGANSGTYTVKNGYVFCTYPSNGYTVEIPYVLNEGEIDLDTIAAFDVH